MQPIPAFNPGDTTIYPDRNGVIQVGAADAGSKMLLYNESPFNINIDFLNGSQSILHAWEARYWTLDGDTRQVEWDINSTLNVTSSPISLVIGELYNAGEKLEGTYPMGLIRQTNVGNPGGIATTSTNQVINDGNTLQEVIEATLSGHGSSDVIINNDGSVTFKGAALLGLAGVLIHILGNLTVDGTSTLTGAITAPGANVLGATGVLTHILGTLTVDQAATISGLLNVAANLKTTNVTNTLGQYVFQDNVGNPLMTLDQNGLTLDPASPSHMKNYAISFRVGSLTRISIFSGTGDGTFNHNLGSTPDIVIPVQNVAGSQTMGYSALTSTQVTIKTGAGLGWTALAIKM